MIDPPWQEFNIVKPGEESSRCTSLGRISHVAHVSAAVRIIEDSKIRSGLVYDKSILKTERIPVVWLSPNDWHGAGGFRYGNVRFSYTWKDLIQGKNYYWVESIKEYKIPAYRILVTTKDYSSLLTPYDPTKGYGPWYFDENTSLHLWNCENCFEVMVESDLHVSNVLEIDFVDHHGKYCSLAGSACSDCGKSGMEAGALFIAALVGRRCSLELFDLEYIDGGKWDRSQFESACENIFSFLSAKTSEFIGSIIVKDRRAKSLARAVLDAYSASDTKEMKLLASMFHDKKALLESCAMVIAGAFGIEDYKTLDFELSL